MCDGGDGDLAVVFYDDDDDDHHDGDVDLELHPDSPDNWQRQSCKGGCCLGLLEHSQAERRGFPAGGGTWFQGSCGAADLR